MAVVALIPARAGSKGIPGKNLIACGGRPLIAHSIVAAREATRVDRVMVSTDDEGIAAVARQWGAEAPFLRPLELANDTAPMLGVLLHALSWLDAAGETVEALVLLQPTSPLRCAVHVDAAIDLFFGQRASSVVSVVEVPHAFNPVSVMKLEDGLLHPYQASGATITRRQDKPAVYARNGPAVLVSAPETLRQGSLYGERCVPLLMSARESIDIDSKDDLEMAEWLMGRRPA
jgi:CMP-N-acetylneuraminic acid synthetase